MMPDFNVLNTGGSAAGSVSGPEHLFGVEPNVPVMHQVVTAQLANRRAGTQSTKTRAEVRGGAAKPWRQKGTGRARAGSLNAPHWRGGGVAMGPKPRSYHQRTPKKMIRLALASALSDRASDGKVRILDDFGISAPKTKDAITVLSKIDVWGKILIIVGPDDAAASKSFANLVGVQVITQDQLNTYDVLVNDFIVFTKATFEATCSSRPAPAARRIARIEAMTALSSPANSSVAVHDDHAEDAPSADDQSADASDGEEE
jgi:large subunit ribosomal protein L4